MKLQAETINKLHEEPTESNHSYDDFNVSKSTISNDRYNVSTENSLKRVTFIHKSLKILIRHYFLSDCVFNLPKSLHK